MERQSLSSEAALEPETVQLIRQIEGFDIDGGPVDLPFHERLARDNGWTVPYARRVVDEYLRFLILATVAGPATPSDAVDQAWHLHLVYTESYWTRLRTILPRPIHHNPTEGGPRERAKFRDWYARTLENYRRIFGSEPPPDIWLPPEKRFQGRFVRFDLDDYWLIDRRRLRRSAVSWAAAALALTAAGCAITNNGGEWAAIALFAFILLLIGGIVILHLLANGRRGSAKSSSSGGCSGGSGGGRKEEGFSDASSDSAGDAGCGSGCGGGCGGGCGS